MFNKIIAHTLWTMDTLERGIEQLSIGDTVTLGDKTFVIVDYLRHTRSDRTPHRTCRVARECDMAANVVLKFGFIQESPDTGRDPSKEETILGLVRGHTGFVQGFTIAHSPRLLVHTIQFENGPTLKDLVLRSSESHPEYLASQFPAIARAFARAVRNLDYLHRQNQYHGDVRGDHLYADLATENFRWNDFEFGPWTLSEGIAHDIYDTQSIFLFAVGRGLERLGAHPSSLDLVASDLFGKTGGTFDPIIASLGKVFPYIPPPVARLLEKLSAGSTFHFESTAQFADAIEEAVEIPGSRSL